MSKKPRPAPNYRSPSGRYYLWTAIARDARRQPGLWLFALSAVPISTVYAVRSRRDLGLEAQARNPFIHDGKSLCDLYVRYREEAP